MKKILLFIGFNFWLADAKQPTQSDEAIKKGNYSTIDTSVSEIVLVLTILQEMEVGVVKTGVLTIESVVLRHCVIQRT